MTEHQNTEYKESWHEDYLKWVCGFANANGWKNFLELMIQAWFSFLVLNYIYPVTFIKGLNVNNLFFNSLRMHIIH
jgi:hypothetical protein